MDRIEQKLQALLEEANRDATNVENLKVPMTNMLSEIVAYCTVCISDAKKDDSGTWVNVDRVTNLKTWSETKAQEIVELSLIKKGEVIAYKRALETLDKRDPGPYNG